MKKSLFPAAVMALVSCLLISCVPFPSSTAVFPRLSGTVVNAQGYTIAGAMVTASRGGFVRRTMTSQLGAFTVPSAMQWHYALNAGRSRVTPPPWYWRTGPAPLIFTATAPGYQSATLSIPAHKDDPNRLILPDRIKLQLFMEGQPAVPIEE